MIEFTHPTDNIIIRIFSNLDSAWVVSHLTIIHYL